jgi:hypothetical protein
MSGYSAGEALILTQLRAISGTVWTSANSGRGTWKMLSTGDSDHYAVLKPGPGDNSFYTMSGASRNFSTIIEVWKSYQADGTSLTDIEGYADAILAKFDARRLLGDTGGTVEDAYCSHWTEVEERWKRGETAPRWLKQEFTIVWTEEANVTFAE